VVCDCGGGWRWEDDGRRFLLRRARPRVAPFSYTLAAPGELEIPELGLRLRLFCAPVQPWMFRGSARRAGLALPLAAGERVTVRSRRPGDRLQPLGAPGRRRLKEVLVDRRVPHRLRDRLPLVCLGERGERIAWVPGVTVDERYRLGAGPLAWVAELDREVADG
jgi:tRNA(Ile)-lysidine synthase